MDAGTVSATLRRTRHSMIAMLVVSLITVGALVAERVIHASQVTAVTERQLDATMQNDRVVLADEMLTMSARMYAATGNKIWKVRYDETVPMIDQALAAVMSLATPELAERFKAETSDANDKLIVLETKSAELAAKGDMPAASAILDGPEYKSEKDRLAQGADRFSAGLDASIGEQFARIEAQSWIIRGISLAAVFLISGVWFWLNRNLARFSREYTVTEQARLKSAEAQKSAEVTADAARQTQRERQLAVEGAITGFRQSIGTTSRDITDGVQQLQETSDNLLGIAATAEAELRSTMQVADTNGEIAQRIADASEELRGSFSEIAHQMAGIRSASASTSSLAATSNAKVLDFANAARQIENIVDVIRAVAEQTNLLALNATIEAARAGDSGKGFAVVANEVKSLANQTAQATSDISKQIGEIRGSIASTVDTMKQVVDNAGQVEIAIASIASVIEQQSSTTDEMSHSAASGARSIESMRDLVNQIGGVLSQANQSAESIARVSAQLSDGSLKLDGSIEQFLKTTEAA